MGVKQIEDALALIERPAYVLDGDTMRPYNDTVLAEVVPPAPEPTTLTRPEATWD